MALAGHRERHSLLARLRTEAIESAKMNAWAIRFPAFAASLAALTLHAAAVKVTTPGQNMWCDK